ncbi:electron transport complex subunit RsxB [Candidatus Fukatsuia symbiotica]|uniref:Ion-translocating oxidoreductase complex subunit B n=1 Tax=Candidatus Fukatsuia symbiotica TaxID=1878942 RepID=A0A2U8I598_9GAMM|nr:electron transport complex subunit RsxB [Candidatus Fukatsuia symbiotica]AWK14331.1 electron transport complex subunit RsxB [Candidatus Fukatsuia symbiotica]MEA9444592.1 electron transport complex subunit RsxB [Candidatus Fukatsuia symbiotica]
MSSLWLAIAALSVLALLCGGILGFAARRFQVKQDPIIEQVDKLLPQSQCGQCSYPGCRPYAEAVANNGEKINKCAPGGEQVMLKLAALLGVEPQPLDGDESVTHPPRKVAFIDESNCIGCTKCIQACPVDAIVGATRAMHTVLTDFCTGCDLCVAPCPTDCIEMRPVITTTANWKWDLTRIPVKTVPIETHSTKTSLIETAPIKNKPSHPIAVKIIDTEQHV